MMRCRRALPLLLLLICLVLISIRFFVSNNFHWNVVVNDKASNEQQNQCEYYKDQSFASGEFLAIRQSSPQQCCALCWQHERCVAWTIHKGLCWLKDELSPPVPVPKRNEISGRLIGSKRQPLSCIKDDIKQRMMIVNDTDKCQTKTVNNTKIIHKRVLFTGLAYKTNDQDAKTIERTFNQLGSYFTDWQALIYENDVDGESALHRIASNHSRIRLISETLHVPFSKQMQFQQYCGRPRLMAFLRQRLLSSIQHLFHSSLLSSSSSSIDFILYFDLDLVANNGVHVESVAKRLCQRQNDSWWDILCAFGKNRNNVYHDTFALRPCDVDFYRQVHHFDRMRSAFATDLSPFLRPEQGFIRVRSCFGGMSVYRADMLAKTTCQYNDTICMCEHVQFHSCLLHEGYDRIFIDTSLFITY